MHRNNRKKFKGDRAVMEDPRGWLIVVILWIAMTVVPMVLTTIIGIILSIILGKKKK